MKIIIKTCMAIVFSFTYLLNAQDEVSSSGTKVLFVYDKVDKGSRFYVDAFKKELGQRVRTVEEAAVGSNPKAADPSTFQYIVIYSRVMAFNMISPVRKWIKMQKSLSDKKIFLYVTSGGICHEANLKGLRKLIDQRGGTVVDAVTMATGKMSEDQKRAAIAKHLEKLAQ